MIYILIAIIVSFAASIRLISIGTDGYTFRHGFAHVAGCAAAVAATLAAAIYPFLAWHWFAAEYKATIINREYGTHYTQAEVFYARDVIKTIRQIDRKRIEINGETFDVSLNRLHVLLKAGEKLHEAFTRQG